MASFRKQPAEAGLSFIFGHARLRQRPHDAPRGGTGCRPCSGSSKPSGRDNRAQAGYRKQAKTSQQVSSAAKGGSYARSCAGTFGAVIHAVAVPIDAPGGITRHGPAGGSV